MNGCVEMNRFMENIGRNCLLVGSGGGQHIYIYTHIDMHTLCPVETLAFPYFSARTLLQEMRLRMRRTCCQQVEVLDHGLTLRYWGIVVF